MIKRIVLTSLIVVAIGFVTLYLINKDNKISANNNQKGGATVTSKSTVNNEIVVKEFSMTSFTEMINGEPKPQFSLKEMVVKKGDRIRIKITEKSGNHDFKIDEFGVYTDTPLNKESIVEFTADKAGDFIYYCTKPMHRQNGQWGTLRVI